MRWLMLWRGAQVDLAKECPFWEEDGSCMNRACGVETTDEVRFASGRSRLLTRH